MGRMTNGRVHHGDGNSDNYTTNFSRCLIEGNDMGNVINAAHRFNKVVKIFDLKGSQLDKAAKYVAFCQADEDRMNEFLNLGRLDDAE